MNRRLILLPLCLIALLLGGVQPAWADSLTICVVDTSRPMQERWGGQSKWELLQTYVLNTIRALPPQDKAALIGFGSDRCQPTLLLPPTDALMAMTQVDAKLSGVVTGGDRTLVGGLESALNMAAESSAAGIRILIFTSGIDQCRERLDSLRAETARVRAPLELQLFGLDMVSDQALDLTEGIGVLGGTFRPFEGAADFTSTIGQTQAPSRPGLQVLINAPANEDDPTQSLAAYLEVYAEGGRQSIWQQSVEGSTLINLPLGKYDLLARYGGTSRWRRGVLVSGAAPTIVQFDFAQGVGRIRLELADPVGNPIQGEVIIVDRESGSEITRERGQSSLALDLAPGRYRAEVRVGSQTMEEDFEVGEDDNRTISLLIEAVLGQALISINNQDLQPINGDLYLYDPESGALLDSWTSTASVRANLAEGEYEIRAKVGTQEESQTFYIAGGDETEVAFELEVPMGSLFVMLQDTGGNAVYGILHVYDSTGNEIKYYDLELFEDSDFSFDLPIGTYSLRANVDGVTRTVSAASVREDEETEVVVEFPKDN